MKHETTPLPDFDPDNAGYSGQLFGMPFTSGNAAVVILPVPWEVTVTYHSGTALAPQAILDASAQVDLFDKAIYEPWKLGISMLPIPEELVEESGKLRELATRHAEKTRNGVHVSPEDPLLRKINEGCENLNIYVKSQTLKLMAEGKLVGVLGGDHSVPLGFIRALSTRYERFAILQIDAHADLRKSYQGYTFSHASVMYNALKLPAVNRLVQVGIRDFGREEFELIQRAHGRVVTFFDQDLREDQYRGKSWEAICDEVVKALPDYVYISFDIDGLDPKLCPGTGTPVPGGLEFQQAVYLLKRVATSGKRIIGFDLNEVAPTHGSDWDANVGARILYNLCNWMGVSNNKLRVKQEK